MIRITLAPPAHPPRMGMMAYLATDGGRRCPQCGKWAKAKDLGNLSFSDECGTVSMYGHKRGKGCNSRRR